MTTLTEQQIKVVQDVKGLILRARGKATDDDGIRAWLIAGGWPVGAVDEAFRELGA